MSELSERARKLRVALAINSFDTERAELIEQALLAERRLAMEEAAKIAESHEIDIADDDFEILRDIAAKLRATAEKEVGAK